MGVQITTIRKKSFLPKTSWRIESKTASLRARKSLTGTGPQGCPQQEGLAGQHGALGDGRSKGFMEKVIERKEQLEVLVRQEEEQLLGTQCAVFSRDPPIEVSRATFKE